METFDHRFILRDYGLCALTGDSSVDGYSLVEQAFFQFFDLTPTEEKVHKSHEERKMCGRKRHERCSAS
jgi:hypothetical protein